MLISRNIYLVILFILSFYNISSASADTYSDAVDVISESLNVDSDDGWQAFEESKRCIFKVTSNFVSHEGQLITAFSVGKIDASKTEIKSKSIILSSNENFASVGQSKVVFSNVEYLEMRKAVSKEAKNNPGYEHYCSDGTNTCILSKPSSKIKFVTNGNLTGLKKQFQIVSDICR